MINFEITSDKTHIKITDSEINPEVSYLKSFFKKKSKDGDFNPLVDNGAWDGMDHFVKEGGLIPIG